jgi:hypothetical protein
MLTHKDEYKIRLTIDQLIADILEENKIVDITDVIAGILEHLHLKLWVLKLGKDADEAEETKEEYENRWNK